MAGDWIKLENVTPDKPEVFHIADRLGIDPDAVVGKLIRIWIWADQQTYDGSTMSRLCHASKVTKSLLDRVTNATGFADAMISCGWLVEQDGGLVFPKFEKHNGKSAKARALGATRKRIERSRSERDISVTREEKRREENKEDNTPYSTPERRKQKRKTAANADRDYSPAFLEFWNAFPPTRKGSKPTAWHAWQAAILRATPEAIIAAVKEFALSDLAKSDYCPGPAPWLNQDRWDDDREAWKRRDGPQPTPTRRFETPMPDLARLAR